MNLQPKKFFFTVFCFARVVRECFYLYTAFGCHYREIHHAILGKTIAFTVSAAVHFGVWASFLDYHCIEITSSSKILSALYYQSKITQQKQTTAPLEPSLLRDHFNGFFETVEQYSSTTDHTLHSGVIYSRLTFLRSFSFHIFSKPTNCPLEITAFNHGFLIQSNSSL